MALAALKALAALMALPPPAMLLCPTTEDEPEFPPLPPELSPEVDPSPPPPVLPSLAIFEGTKPEPPFLKDADFVFFFLLSPPPPPFPPQLKSPQKKQVRRMMIRTMTAAEEAPPIMTRGFLNQAVEALPGAALPGLSLGTRSGFGLSGCAMTTVC